MLKTRIFAWMIETATFNDGCKGQNTIFTIRHFWIAVQKWPPIIITMASLILQLLSSLLLVSICVDKTGHYDKIIICQILSDYILSYTTTREGIKKIKIHLRLRKCYICTYLYKTGVKY